MKAIFSNRMPAIYGAALLSFCALTKICVAEMSDIPVPLITLEPGHKVEFQDLVSKNFYVSDAAAKLFATSSVEVEGKVTKRALIKGKPIALAYLRASGLVAVGVPTRVTFQKNGLTITAMLVPLQPGVVGQTIDARNPDSGKIVKATVTEDGVLQVPAQ